VDPALVALVETLYGLDQAGLDQVLDQLMPRAFAEMYTLSLNRLQDVQKTVSDRLNTLGTALTGGGEHEVLSMATGVSGEWNAWTNAYGSFRSSAANPGAGEGGTSVNSFGDVTGVEKRMGRATIGMFGAVGTSSAQMSLPNSSVKSESWHIGTYMSLPLGTRMFMDVLGLYGEAQNTVRQTQTLPGGTFQSRALALSEEMLLQVGLGGQLAAMGSKWTVVPSVRLAYAAMHFEKATREGAGGLGIKSEAKWQSTMLSRTGLEVGREGRIGRMPVRMSASAAWVHDFAPNPREMQVSWEGLESAKWSVSGTKRAADAVRVGGAFEMGVGERRTLRLYGEQEFIRGNNVLRAGINFTIGF
jgi:hypothetical protein